MGPGMEFGCEVGAYTDTAISGGKGLFTNGDADWMSSSEELHH